MTTILRPRGSSTALSSLQETFQLLNVSRQVDCTGPSETSLAEAFRTLSKCPWKCTEIGGNCPESKSAAGDATEEIVLDLKKFVKEAAPELQKCGYDKSIRTARVAPDDGKIREAANVAKICSGTEV